MIATDRRSVSVLKSGYTTVAGLLVIVMVAVSTEVRAQEPSEGEGVGVQPPEVVPLEKRAQTGFKFLQTTAGARASALANTVVAERNGSSVSLFYNPASMAEAQSSVDVHWSNAQWIADISYNFASAAYRPANGQYGVFGISVVDVAYPEQNQTIRADTDQGYREVGSFNPSASGFGLGYARQFSTQFSAGAQVKYVHQDLGDHPQRLDSEGSLTTRSFSEGTLAYDFGVLFRTGFRSLTLGMNARNFAPEITYVRESFELPLTFRFGMGMDLVDLMPASGDRHSLLVNANFRRPRDFSEQIRLGLEYGFFDTAYLRGGWVHPTDQRGFSLGAGVKAELSDVEFRFDYAWTEFGVFSGVNRISAQIRL